MATTGDPLDTFLAAIRAAAESMRDAAGSLTATAATLDTYASRAADDASLADLNEVEVIIKQGFERIGSDTREMADRVETLKAVADHLGGRSRGDA